MLNHIARRLQRIFRRGPLLVYQQDIEAGVAELRLAVKSAGMLAVMEKMIDSIEQTLTARLESYLCCERPGFLRVCVRNPQQS